MQFLTVFAFCVVREHAGHTDLIKWEMLRCMWEMHFVDGKRVDKGRARTALEIAVGSLTGGGAVLQGAVVIWKHM
jgi:hypothetical protein